LFSGIKASDDHDVKACGQEYFSTWKLGFQRSYHLEPKQGAFDGKLNAMVIGGGSKVAKLKEMLFSKFPGPTNFAPPIPVPDLGTPSDLFDLPLSGIRPTSHFEGDSSFLLVAYGLSVNNRDFPETILSPDVPPFDPQPRRRAFKSSEDLGYDK